MPNDKAIGLPSYGRGLEAVASLLSAFILLYIGFELLPREIVCRAAGAQSAACAAEAVRFPGGETRQFDLELQAILALAALGMAGGFIERLLRRPQWREDDPGFVSVWGGALGRFLQILVAALAGAIAAVAIPSLLIDSPVPYAEVDVETLAVIAFLAGFGAPRLIPELIAHAGTTRQLGDRPAEGDTSKHLAQSTEAADAIREIAARLDMIFDQPTLDNWCGKVSVRVEAGTWVEDEAGEMIAIDEGESIPLRISFVPAAGPELPPGSISETIDISGGNSTEAPVLFNVALDGRGLGLASRHAAAAVEALHSRPSEVVLETGPLMEGPHDIIVEISQKGRLIQTLIVSVLVMAKSQGD